MAGRTAQWVEAIVESQDPELTAAEITAARVATALESEAGRPFRNPTARIGELSEFQSTESNLAVLAYPDPFSHSPTSPVALMVGQKTLTITDVGERYQLTPYGIAMMRSAATNMHAAAVKLSEQRSNMTLHDFSTMGQQQLYLLFEQGNGERQQRLPLAHVFSGNLSFHPYLGDGKVSLLLTPNSNTTNHRGVAFHDRSTRYDSLTNGGVIVHPQSQDRFRQLGSARQRIEAIPTASTRTLYMPDKDLHIKTSFDAVITSDSRLLQPLDGTKGLAVTHLLHDIHRREALPNGTFFLPELHSMADNRDTVANSLIRGGLADIVPTIDKDDRVIPAFGLTIRLPFADNKTLLEMLVEKNGPTMFDRIVQAMIKNHMQLADLGTNHESHGQNTMLIFNKDFTELKGICIRDIGSIFIDPARLEELQLEIPTGYGYNPPTVREKDSAFRTARLCRCILTGQVSIGAEILIGAGVASAPAVRDTVRDAIAKNSSAYTPTWLEPSFYSGNSTTAIMNAEKTKLRVIQNPLWGDTPRNLGSARELNLPL